MIPTPQLQGNIARNCHPLGCQAQLQHQADYVLSQAKFSGAKRVLVIGASSGYGLAARMALMLGSDADSVGIAYEKGASERGLGTAGWYNSIYFRELAESHGRVATNIIGDAFLPQTRQAAIEAIQKDLGGQVDLVIYSLATGRRTTAEGSWQSVLKTTEQPLTGYSIDLETEALIEETIPVATDAEVEGTMKVMGGEDWELWMDELGEAGVLAPGCMSIAFSYLGPDISAPIYRNGTIGAAKEHLHQSAARINTRLQKQYDGGAHACVAKALVTKASVYIPVISPYIALLYKVMKQQGLHEECIEQAYRLFSQNLFGPQGICTDSEGLIRIDDRELSPAVQSEVLDQIDTITPENFKELTDYQGYRSAFLRLNGFAVPGVDYQQDLDIEAIAALRP